MTEATSTTRVKFTRVREGRYVEESTGIELVRGIDDSDGYDRIEWSVWTAGMDRQLSIRDSLSEAKARTRELIARGL